MTQPYLPTLLLSLFLIGGLCAQDQPCGTVTIANPDTVSICQGDVLELMQTNDLTDATVSWSPAAGFIDAVTDPSPRVAPPFSGYIRVVVSGTGCQVADSIYVDVDRLVVPELIGDTTVCQGYPLSLVRTPVTDRGDTRYTFSPGEDFLDDSTDVNSIYNPRVDTVFQLISTSENGVCADTQSVAIDVTPSQLIIAEDTAFVCLGGGPVELTVSVIPAADGEVRWSPDRFALSAPAGSTFTVEPTADITYFAEATVNGCFQRDSIAVRLDSLPVDLSMMLDPEKDPYCQGDTFFVRSQVYDVGDFPLIRHNWFEAPGIQSPLDLYNGVFLAQDTALLMRRTVNGACVDTAEILVNVVEPPMVVFDPADPLVCAGEPLQITATFVTGSGTLEWMDPGSTLSCTDCLDPIATVSMDTEYMIEVTAEGSQCTMPLTYTVRVTSDVAPQLTTQTAFCAGDQPFRLIEGGVLQGYTYRITGGGIDTEDTNVLLSPTETTTYTVETMGPCGMSTQTITVNAGGSYALTVPEVTGVRADQALTLAAELSPQVSGTFSWLLPDGSQLSGQTITIDRPDAGVYSVTFTDDQGCSASFDRLVTVSNARVIVPEVITPNGDGTNDNFRIFFNGTISDYTMTVWNRWGQKVFTSNDPNEEWDGSVNGTPQTQDTYLYLAKFTQDGVALERDGQFTLVR